MGKIRNLHDSHETKSVARSRRLTLRFWSLRIVPPKIQSRRHPKWERYIFCLDLCRRIYGIEY